MPTNVMTIEAETHRSFEEQFDAIEEVDAAVPPNHITDLLARFNAAVNDPASQSLGGFVQTLQAIQGELHMMAGSLGVAVANAHADVDWEAILSAADAGGGHEMQAVEFTPEELAALTVS
jgi:hypothetical protein